MYSSVYEEYRFECELTIGIFTSSYFTHLTKLVTRYPQKVQLKFNQENLLQNSTYHHYAFVDIIVLDKIPYKKKPSPCGEGLKIISQTNFTIYVCPDLLLISLHNGIR